MNLTQHARARMQQRGIPRQAIDYVLAYGRVSHDHRGACVVWLDKRSRARLGREAGRQVIRKLKGTSQKVRRLTCCVRKSWRMLDFIRNLRTGVGCRYLF